jgi:hypothetical protein
VALLAADFHDVYHQYFSEFHAYKAKIMPKLFILMSSVSFVAYLISGAHCAKVGQFGRNPGGGRPAWHCGLLSSKFTCMFTNTSQAILTGTSTLVFKLRTASLSNMHALINKAVQWRAERSQS